MNNIDIPRFSKLTRTLFATLFLAYFYLPSALISQNTVGLLSYVPSQSYPGYNLIYPHNQPNVYLLNNCGEIVHQWTDEPQYRPANTAYLMPDGRLVKTKRDADFSNDRMWAGGGGAIVEIRSWDNDLLWQFEMNNDSLRLHHDISLHPNGNIFMIAWELKTREEAIAAGRDTSLLAENEIWSDVIFEVNPANDQIVWEWRAWDHLIQDFDSTKANYGVISENIGKIDINYDRNDAKADWLHANALDFNHLDMHDLLMLSVPYFDEVWIIDHGISAEVAATSNGGRANIGGDLWYRWGNPLAYQRGDSTDQKLFFQHDAHWILDQSLVVSPFFNKIAVFNNRAGNGYSTTNIFDPPFEPYVGAFENPDPIYLPTEFELTTTHPDTFELFSTGLSSTQLLPNGNQLICSGRFGYAFEVTPDQEVVWEYKTPIKQGTIVPQGTILEINNNLTFRMHRYAENYADFISLGLTNEGYLELEPDTGFCNDIISSIPENMIYDLKAYPNPASSQLTLEWTANQIANIEVIDILGRKMRSFDGMAGRMYIDISDWSEGFYLISIDGEVAKKIFIQR